MATAGRPVRREDIEAKLREITGPVRDGARSAAPVGMAAGVAIAAVVVVGVYLLGRRRGRRRSTLLEIRRV